MKRITHNRLALFTLVLLGVAIGTAALAASNPTPTPTSAIVKERIFNDCPTSTVTSVNHYPDLISIQDSNLDCFGFANLHVWRFSEDGATEAVFDNNASFRFGADFKIEGDGNGEGGLQIAPWWSHDADGLFNVRSTDGEIACFGGRLPFFTFTGAFGLHYVKGDVIHLEMIYEPRALNATRPATIEYKLSYQGHDYTSGALAFDMANPAEDPPHGLWGMLNDGRVGGHFKAFLGQGTPVTVKATFTNVTYGTTPLANSAVTKERVFNDCPTSTLVTTNNYPALISFDDSNLDCFGFANLHIWRFSEDGVNAAIFNNNAKFRFSADFKIEGDGNGEGGLQIAPWWSHDADGLFNVRSTDGEIACFGGRLPFYTFTGAYGLHYVKGDVIHLEVAYDAHGRSATDPATVEYKLSYLGNDYTSGPLAFDMANPAEDPPYGLYGMLNDGQAGGHFKAFLGQGNPVQVKASFTNIKYSLCVNPAAVTLNVMPNFFNFWWWDRWVTAYIRVAPPLKASDIDVASLRLNGVPVSHSYFATRILFHDTVLKARFDRSAVRATLSPGNHVPVLLTGEIGAQCIEAVDYIKVRGPRMHHPCHDDHLIAGTTTQVTWELDPETPADAANVLMSLDNGETWTVEAAGVPNTGSYSWHVPSLTAPSVLLAISLIYDVDEDGIVNESEYAQSEAFDITVPTGVGDGSVAFALKGATPNPGRDGRLNVTFALPSREPGSLTLFDVTGRVMMSRDLSAYGPGTHTVQLGSGLKPGVYMVRLTQAGRTLKGRAVVIE